MTSGEVYLHMIQRPTPFDLLYAKLLDRFKAEYGETNQSWEQSHEPLQRPIEGSTPGLAREINP